MGFIIKPIVTEKMTAITEKSSREKSYKVKGEVMTKASTPLFGFIVRPYAKKLQIKS